MALLDDVKAALRLSTGKMDAEVQMLVGAALYDMGRVGVDPALLEADEGGELPNMFVKHAVIAYAKAHFGYDNDEAERLDDSYRRIVCDLMNSSANIAAMAQAAAPAASRAEGEGE